MTTLSNTQMQENSSSKRRKGITKPCNHNQEWQSLQTDPIRVSRKLCSAAHLELPGNPEKAFQSNMDEDREGHCAYLMLYGKTPFADPRIMNHEGGLVNHAFRDKFLPQICAYLMVYGKTPFVDPRIMNHEGGLVNHAFRDKFLPQICAYLMLYVKTPFVDPRIMNHEGGHALYDRMCAFLRVSWNVSVADYHKK